MDWRTEVYDTFRGMVDKNPDFSVELKKVAIVLHYRKALLPEVAALEAAECKRKLEEAVSLKWPIEIINGKRVLEARPLMVNKGATAQRIIHELMPALTGALDFVFCAGDDVTDEGTQSRSLHVGYKLSSLNRHVSRCKFIDVK